MTYLKEILARLIAQKPIISDFVFVLPSKRAGIFLKKELRTLNAPTQFTPEIISIEEFIEKIADLKIATSIELLFELYDVYLKEKSILEKEPFESFASWASILIDDFNEIDRNLIDHRQIFNYLNEIKEIEHWHLNGQKTTLIKNYLSFWNTLPLLYENFSQQIKQKGFAHQGLVYREAAETIEHYIQSKNNKTHIFIGFNALNKAEETIIQEMLENSNTQAFWDAESFFIDKPYHSASLFLREIKNKWKYYKTNPFQTVSAFFEQPKTIQLTSCTNNIAQVKCTSEILASLKPEEIEKTALVLADENLLIPMLNSLPENIHTVNITMGLPLKSVPVTSFFDALLKIHRDQQQAFYYKEVLDILNHPLCKSILPKSIDLISQYLLEKNITHINFQQLISVAATAEQESIHHLFSKENHSVNALIAHSKQILLTLKEQTSHNDLLIQSLYKLYEVWNKLETLNNKYAHIKNTKTLYLLFNEITASTSIDFKGEPYQGLQIMGLLETRALDFERIIMLSINEGTLPAGKSNKSFLTFDMQQQFGLPTHREKDAVYAYHFYRLLHRSKNIDLLYNNQSGGLNAGEKSRFLMQLTYEHPQAHTITELVYSLKIEIPEKELKHIQKTPIVVEKLKMLLSGGLSPSAITTYVRNPLEFYDRYILDIREVDEVEETVAANTLGTIVHNTLEELYKPFIDEILSTEILKQLIKKIENQVTLEFKNAFKEGNIESGKNKIIFEIAKRYVENFLKTEMLTIEKENEIVIRSLENQLEIPLDVPGLDFQIKLKGTVDRIDTFNGTTRIIDYKTGLVQQTQLNLSDWETLFSDYDKHSKKIQVLAYTLMCENSLDYGNTQAGIVSFRNLSSGFLPFTNKTSAEANPAEITHETLTNFKAELIKIILEICDPNIPFIEKEIKKYEF